MYGYLYIAQNKKKQDVFVKHEYVPGYGGRKDCNNHKILVLTFFVWLYTISQGAYMPNMPGITGKLAPPNGVHAFSTNHWLLGRKIDAKQATDKTHHNNSP